MKIYTCILVMGLMTLGVSAKADVGKMVGTWDGVGSSYSMEGDPQGDYAIQMVSSLQSDGSVESLVNVAIPGAPDKLIEFVLRDTAKGYSMTSAQGSGGSLCFEPGLCEGYFGDFDGNGVAMTLIRDGSDRFRMVKTLLQGFHAVGLSFEQYSKE